MRRFKALDIWHRSRLLSSEGFKLPVNFCNSEKFGLTNQRRRAFVSIPSNIAEDFSRKSIKDFSRFLEITGSCCEIKTQWLVSSDLKLINEVESYNLSKELEEIIKMISKFTSTLKVYPV